MVVLIDSSVWVSYIHLDDIHHNVAQKEIEELINDSALIIISEIVYAEVTNVLTRNFAGREKVTEFKKFLKENDSLVEIIYGSSKFWLLTIEEIASLVKLKTLDLIILAYGIHFGVDKFVTLDRALERAFKQMKSQRG